MSPAATPMLIHAQGGRSMSLVGVDEEEEEEEAFSAASLALGDGALLLTFADAAQALGCLAG